LSKDFDNFISKKKRFSIRTLLKKKSDSKGSQRKNFLEPKKEDKNLEDFVKPLLFFKIKFQSKNLEKKKKKEK
jgi:hypothetical protein